MLRLMSTTHYRTCNLCEAMCGLEVELDGAEVLSIRGDEHDVFSRGHVCPKATALKDLYDLFSSGQALFE